MTKNDKRILLLQEKLEQVKQNVKSKQPKFTPLTNCSIEMDGRQYNLHVNTKEELLYLLLRLQSMNEAIPGAMKLFMKKMDEQELLNDIRHIKISGFTINEWLHDIVLKLRCMEYEKCKAELKSIEAEFEKLLSENRKTEIALNKSESKLNSLDEQFNNK